MTIGSLFEQSIAAEFPHEFTPHQREAVSAIGSFLADPRNDQAFVLRGYAGTGKTSLVSAVVRVWRKLQRPVVLLAPTGRAAKVFSLHAGLPAHTIHRVIYRQKSSRAKIPSSIADGTMRNRPCSSSMRPRWWPTMAVTRSSVRDVCSTI